LLGIGETFKGANGKRNMLRGTVQDITERKKAEETNRKFAILESKSKEMEQFAYIASHDLREPLLTIRSYVDLLTEEHQHKMEGDAAESLRRISRAAARMDELMQGLLDYSRLSKVKELQAVDCNQVVNDVIADLASLIQNNNAFIEVGNLPMLRAYPLEMKQLFQNLLANGIKFKKGGTDPVIHVSASKINGVWTFKVSDNGIGIEDSDKEKIFALFQRLHNRNEYAGSGIGLAYCKKIVELHHGTIWVESVPGMGSAFYFTILT
ncbi:MAG TPA: ATP-binding protein, partial [Chitinophagales bacterium]|nr:ATP-binding protein [Chitinophagales bacterium]